MSCRTGMEGCVVYPAGLWDGGGCGISCRTIGWRGLCHVLQDYRVEGSVSCPAGLWGVGGCVMSCKTMGWRGLCHVLQD